MNDDLDAIMAIMARAFDPAHGEAWTRRQVADALLLPGTHYLLATAPGSGVPCGFALTRQVLDEEELLLLAVLPEMRRKGVAAGLLQRLFAAAPRRGTQRIFLEMREDNPARHLYINNGFEQIGVRRGYYRKASGGPKDALTFSRNL